MSLDKTSTFKTPLVIVFVCGVTFCIRVGDYLAQAKFVTQLISPVKTEIRLRIDSSSCPGITPEP